MRESDTITRFFWFMQEGGTPAHTAKVTDGGVTFTFPPGTTPEQAAAGETRAALFDPSPEAQAAWEEGRNRERAKRYVLAADPLPLAVRAACVALMLSLQECRAKVNEVLAAAQAGDGSLLAVAALQTGDTTEEAFGQVLQLIDAGLV